VVKESALCVDNQHRRRCFSQGRIEMEHKFVIQYMHQYLKEAIDNSDGKPAGIANYLSEIPMPGRFSRHKEEKIRALKELRQAFDEHRHWPLDIILSQLGIDVELLQGK
jgi:hypothetical protein